MTKYFWILFLIPLFSTTEKIEYYNYCEALKNKKAFIFSWANFDNNQKLNSPHIDSDSTKKILISKYGFEVHQYKDFSNEGFKATLATSLRYTPPETPIIIYLISRGKFNDLFQHGFLVTKDSRPNDEYFESFTNFTLIRKMLQNSSNKNILLITDIDFDLHINPFHSFDNRSDLKKFERKTDGLLDICRHEVNHKEIPWISSGSYSYGKDSDSTRHLSPFGEALITSLNSNIETAEKLYSTMKQSNDKVHYELLGGKDKYYFRLK